MNEEQKRLLESQIKKAKQQLVSYRLIAVGLILISMATFWLIVPLIFTLPIIFVMGSRIKNTEKEISEAEYKLAGD